VALAAPAAVGVVVPSPAHVGWKSSSSTKPKSGASVMWWRSYRRCVCSGGRSSHLTCASIRGVQIKDSGVKMLIQIPGLWALFVHASVAVHTFVMVC